MNLSTSVLEAMWSQGRKQQFCFRESKVHSEVRFGQSFIKFLSVSLQPHVEQQGSCCLLPVV